MTIIGFDIGAHRIAVASPHDQQSVYIDWSKSYSGRPHLRHKELLEMRAWVRETTGPDAVPVIEKAFLSGGAGRNPSVTIAIAETSAIIQSAHRWRSNPILVPPTTWKKAVIGNHIASKEEIRQWLQLNRPELYEKAPLTEDETDAYCIAIYGEMLMAGQIDPPAPKKRKRRKPRGPKEEA